MVVSAWADQKLWAFNNWGEYEGRVYIYYGDPNLANLASCDATIDGPITSAFGVGVLIGDINADGIEDLMVGASGYPSGQQWGTALINQLTN